MGTVRFSQQRYSEAASLLKEYVQRTDSPTGYGYLAATYGHLGRIDEAKSALARRRELTSSPEGSSNLFNRDPKLIQALLDGIAMADGKIPSDALTDG